MIMTQPSFSLPARITAALAVAGQWIARDTAPADAVEAEAALKPVEASAPGSPAAPVPPPTTLPSWGGSQQQLETVRNLV
jgi:hypothetical protein